MHGDSSFLEQSAAGVPVTDGGVFLCGTCRIGQRRLLFAIAPPD